MTKTERSDAEYASHSDAVSCIEWRPDHADVLASCSNSKSDTNIRWELGEEGGGGGGGERRGGREGGGREGGRRKEGGGRREEGGGRKEGGGREEGGRR